MWNKQDYQTKGKKWRDRSEWIITENAHPAIITKELFEQCQTVAKQRHNGGGETHRASGKPASPFWLRGMMVCDKCGTRMVGNSTSSRTKSGGQKYYVCGGYLRKGKEFCPYVGWRKERIEEIVTNKLRTTLMRLLMDNQLEEEIRLYHADQHRHSIQQATSLEAEIGFLQKRIQTIEADMRSGKAKPYHQEMLDEMQAELSGKTTEHEVVKEMIGDIAIPEEYIASVKYDMQTLIGLLDAEVPSPQTLNQWVGKFVSEVRVERVKKRFFISIELMTETQTLFKKNLVGEF